MVASIEQYLTTGHTTYALFHDGLNLIILSIQDKLVG